MATSCPVVIIPIEKTLWEAADLMWIGVALAISLVIGIILAVFCARCIFTGLARRKRLNDEEAARTKQVLSSYENNTNSDKRPKSKSKKPRSQLIMSNGSVVPVDRKKKKSKKRDSLQNGINADIQGKAGESRKPHMSDASVMMDALQIREADLNEEHPNRPGRRGLADALLQPNGEAMNLELSSQDVDAVWLLENELQNDRLLTYNQLVKMLLNILFQDGQISPEFFQTFSKEVRDSIIALLGEIKEEQENEENGLRMDKELEKDPIALEKAIGELPAKYAQRLNMKIKEQQDKIRTDMIKSSGMSEADIEKMMSQLTTAMAASERKFSEQMNQQAATLEERILRRKQLAQLKLMHQKESKDETSARADAHEKNLEKLVHDGKLLDRQKNELLSEYDVDVQRVEEKLALDLLRAEQTLQEKLSGLREQRMRKLSEKQRQEVIDICNKQEKATTTAEFIQEFHALRENQRIEEEDTVTQLDQIELKQLGELRSVSLAQRQQSLEKEDETFIHDIENVAQLSSNEVDRLMQLHQLEMEEFERIKLSERKRMQMKMAERLVERKKRLHEESLRDSKEQEVIIAQQKNAVQKVLDLQIDLDDKSKDRIMKEHEQNMQALTNQLSISKLKQQKELEMKLNTRKQKLAQLKIQQEEVKNNNRYKNQKEKEKLEAELAKQIEAEEALVEADRIKAISELRRRLKTETNEALQAQEQQLGMLIGRLQLGQARRQAIIMKQDASLKKLQDQIADQPTSVDLTDQILQKHFNEVSDLSDKMKYSRERQERILREKLEQKKLLKERVIEKNLQDEAYKEMDEAHKRGAGNASAILMQAMLETKHRSAMDQLEREMQIELQKHMENFNKDMEKDLAKELENQRKCFLEQLIATGKVTKPEAMKVVAGIEDDSKSKRKMSYAMELEMERTKTNLSKLDEGNKLEIGYDNPAYEDTFSDNLLDEQSKKKKSKKKKDVQFNGDQEDDDF